MLRIGFFYVTCSDVSRLFGRPVYKYVDRRREKQQEKKDIKAKEEIVCESVFIHLNM